MNARLILFALHEMAEIGWKTIFKLLQFFDDLSELTEASPEDFQKLNITASKAQTIRKHLNEAFINQKMLPYAEHGIEILTIYDEAYPSLLKQTSQPPWVLYCKGDLQLLQRPAIAIVGTRVPTVYGKNTAELFARTLARAGFCIVSGMARGIDSMAHQGALNEKGGTIAVLGCGVDMIYPRENNILYYDIARKGLLLSEFPFGTEAQPGLFPLRNRIIAGLSVGTLVVEAAFKSGSLITADQALDESRDVFAIPGPINSPKSQGALALIKAGAKLVVCAEDMIEDYKHLISPQFATLVPLNKETCHEELNEDEQDIYNLLSTEPTTFDTLLEESQTNFGHLHAILLSLLMKKQINQLPGSAYCIR
jgi:DNA processing protein